MPLLIAQRTELFFPLSILLKSSFKAVFRPHNTTHQASTSIKTIEFNLNHIVLNINENFNFDY
ncbi:MAG: hypothetical protein K2X69_00235 [Silvanigrellaceae bacterium]|nr:hypothetical protein [Silvanigrellaceae bacterium]